MHVHVHICCLGFFIKLPAIKQSGVGIIHNEERLEEDKFEG